MARGRLAPRTVLTKEAAKERVLDAKPRFVLVHLSKADLDDLQAWGKARGWNTDEAASALLAWALDNVQVQTWEQIRDVLQAVCDGKTVQPS